ncbi:MAG: hypothetical protein EBT48_08530, partial [Verrucomicrobia bacterium]|nr:hypothetical protein [Verrucomicrobiota bacterium]
MADSDKSGVGFVDLRQNVSLKSNAGDIVLQSASGLAINSTVSIDATMLTSISTAIWGGQRFSGNVTIQPSSTLTATSPATTVDVGGSGTGALKITQAMVNTITLLDPQDVTSAKAGYLTLGSRSAGDMKIGLIQAGPTGAYNLRLASGGNITQSAAGFSVDTSGIVVLDSAGRIGDAFVAHAATGNPIGITGNRLGVITEGDSFQVSSTSALRQLYVQTDGTVADQKIADTGANLRGNNLNYDVYESQLNTLIGAGGFASVAATPGGVGGLYVDSGAIDFSYINTGGGITVGTAGITASPTIPAIYGTATASVWPGISFGIMAVQDPVSKGVGTASG